MPNTSLPTNITAGSPGVVEHANTVHAEMNRLSRDTAWRDISSLLANGWKLNSGGHLRIRRKDDRVVLSIVGLNGDDASSGTFINAGSAAPALDMNFTPESTVITPLYRRSPATDGAWWIAVAPNGFTTYTPSGAGPITLTGGATIQATWYTGRAWVSRLPAEA